MNSKKMEPAPALRGLRIALWLLVCCIGALRFIHLTADFPNDSPWMIDQAKFTDEGWWTSAAVQHVITGHWYLAGDYNPAVALPIWPLLVGVVFRFTGVSLIAARSLSVAFSLATLLLVYLLVRRYTRSGAWPPAYAAMLLLALSAFAFVFSRLAILDSLVTFEFCLSMLVASFATPRRIWPLAALAALVTIMLLTKTTSAVLIPSIFWLTWSTAGCKLVPFLRATFAVAIIPIAIVKGYSVLVAALGYGADYQSFFDLNSMENYVWPQSFVTLTELLRNSFWIDQVLYPVALAILVVTVFWKRKLWSNPLYSASWLAMAGLALYIFRRQQDYAPRYFLVMLVPLVFVVVLALDNLLARPAEPSSSPHLRANRQIPATALLLLAMAASAVVNGMMLTLYLAHPEYQFINAANSIRAIIGGYPEQKPLILGASGPQISLMAGVPSINDGYGTEDMAEKIARDQPGWYLAWSGVSSDDASLLARYQLQKVASYPVFDDDERTPLILYKMTPRTH